MSATTYPQRTKINIWKDQLVRDMWTRALRCVALNDEPTMMDPEEMTGLISIGLIAETFGVTELEVAKEIVSIRKRVYG